MEGYEVAASDLRDFAKVLSESGGEISKLASRVDGADLSFDTPVVGLGFKGTYAAVQESVRSAINALGSAWTAAGQKLTETANAYETNERNAAAAMTPTP
jgi:uncharacterized protein YukE